MPDSRRIAECLAVLLMMGLCMFALINYSDIPRQTSDIAWACFAGIIALLNRRS